MARSSDREPAALAFWLRFRNRPALEYWRLALLHSLYAVANEFSLSRFCGPRPEHGATRQRVNDDLSRALVEAPHVHCTALAILERLKGRLFLAMRLQRGEEEPLEKVRVREIRVHRSRSWAEPCEAGEFPLRDFVRDLEGKFEPIRHLGAEPRHIGWRGKAVVARIDANRGEGLRVVVEARLVEFRLRELPARQVAWLVVDRSAPTRIPGERSLKHRPSGSSRMRPISAPAA